MVENEQRGEVFNIHIRASVDAAQLIGGILNINPAKCGIWKLLRYRTKACAIVATGAAPIGA